MADLPLLRKLFIISGWIVASYIFSSSIVETGSIQDGLFILMVCAGLWMSEIIPLPVTALLVPVLAYFFKILSPVAAMAPFSNTIIFLFMGGFTLAAGAAGPPVPVPRDRDSRLDRRAATRFTRRSSPIYTYIYIPR